MVKSTPEPQRRAGAVAVVWSVAALLLPACSDSAGTAGTTAAADAASTVADTGAGAPAEVASYPSFLQAYVQADCERHVRCGAKPAYADVAACLAAITPEATRQRQRIADSVAAGKTSYSAPAAAACLVAVRSACTTPNLDVLAACNKVIAGSVAIGQDCAGHFECAKAAGTTSGPFCFNGCTGLFGGEDPPATGKCLAVSPVGTPACK